MSELRARFVGQVRGVVASASESLTSEERARIEHLVDHDEHGEALLTLAWIIVNGDKHVPAETHHGHSRAFERTVAEEHLPPRLDDYVVDGPT